MLSLCGCIENAKRTMPALRSASHTGVHRNVLIHCFPMLDCMINSLRWPRCCCAVPIISYVDLHDRAWLQGEIGKGAFQELDQVAAVQQFCKYAGRADSPGEIAAVVTAAVKVRPANDLLWHLRSSMVGAGGSCHGSRASVC